MATETWTLEQAEEEIANLRGLVDKLSEIVTTTDLRLVEANGRMGTATLVAGTVVVANTTVTVTTRVFLSRTVAGGALGHLSRQINAGVSFTINSSSATETSSVAWLLIEPG